jgi:hypothetical protein
MSDREALTEAIRKLNDLSDVIRAIGLSVGELEKLELALIGLLAQQAIDDDEIPRLT